MMTLGDFIKDLIDDASDSVVRLQREGEHLRELKKRADFGLKVLGEVAKDELEMAFERIGDRIREMSRLPPKSGR